MQEDSTQEHGEGRALMAARFGPPVRTTEYIQYGASQPSKSIPSRGWGVADKPCKDFPLPKRRRGDTKGEKLCPAREGLSQLIRPDV